MESGQKMDLGRTGLGNRYTETLNQKISKRLPWQKPVAPRSRGEDDWHR
jgi:hypothetical protein